jgi:anthranilate phosphoribosyltransferase
MNINPSSLKLTDIDQNAKICLSILKNKNHTLTKWAVLTSAILLIAYGITEDLKEAIDMSEKSLKLNSANEMFEIYKNISNSEMKTNV